VTVEAAIALGGLALVLYVVLAGFATVLGQLMCQDAAREGARLLARDEAGTAHEAVARIAPAGADLKITTAGEHIHIEVSMPAVLPGLPIDADAYAVAEP
jgi:hypothetical protein